MRLHAFALSALSLVAVQGCKDWEYCVIGEIRCDGVALKECTGSIDRFPFGESGPRWKVRVCSGTCVQISPKEALCAESEVPEPRCEGLDAFCDGSIRVNCDRGFSRDRVSCAEDCGVAPNDPDCFPEFACNYDEGVEIVRCFNEAWLVKCRGNDLMEASQCETRCLQLDPRPAACARPQDAEPLCLERMQSTCDGNTVVRCASGFAIERHECAENRVCRVFSYGAVCDDGA
jgi:hypothetical protein